MEVPPSALENLRKGDLLFALPLIGGGRRFLHAAYLPFPAMPRLLEAPQDYPIPFLRPIIPWPTGAWRFLRASMKTFR